MTEDRARMMSVTYKQGSNLTLLNDRGQNDRGQSQDDVSYIQAGLKLDTRMTEDRMTEDRARMMSVTYKQGSNLTL